MRINIPTIPQAALLAATTLRTPLWTPQAAADRIAEFLAPGNAAVLSGAGVSVDSGIRAYRGQDGRPILYHELVDESSKGFAFRQRYWLRSYLGYPPVRDAQPNTTHFALAALQHSGHVNRLITQNVDGLHHKAISSIWSNSRMLEYMLELHGTLHKVHCKYGHVVDRETFQTWLSERNPKWAAFADEIRMTGTKPRTNPDGDVVLDGVDYDDFIVPECPRCLEEYNMRVSVQKPNLTFFGESLPPMVRDRSFEFIGTADRLFVIGTTLATFSSFRLLKYALDNHKPVLMLNVGPTRADLIKPLVEKIEIPSSFVIRDVVRNLVGSKATQDPVLRRFLSMGIHQPPV